MSPSTAAATFFYIKIDLGSFFFVDGGALFCTVFKVTFRWQYALNWGIEEIERLQTGI